MYQKNNTKEADGLNKHQRKWSDYWGSEKSDAYRSEKQMVLKQEVQSYPDTCVCVCVCARACMHVYVCGPSRGQETMNKWAADLLVHTWLYTQHPDLFSICFSLLLILMLPRDLLCLNLELCRKPFYLLEDFQISILFISFSCESNLSLAVFLN